MPDSRVLASQDETARSTGGYAEGLAVTSAAGPWFPDLDLGNVIDLTLTGDLQLGAPGINTVGRAVAFTLVVRQDATGGHALTFDAGVFLFAGGVAPTIASGPNQVSVLSALSVDDGETWYASLAGADYQ